MVLINETLVESNVMWLNAPKSIIHALLEIGAETLKKLTAVI
jgi:hypothetical protein